MMRHFDMKRYPRERGKRFIHYFGEAIIQGGRLFEGGGATIQGNTVYIDSTDNSLDENYNRNIIEHIH